MDARRHVGSDSYSFGCHGRTGWHGNEPGRYGDRSRRFGNTGDDAVGLVDNPRFHDDMTPTDRASKAGCRIAHSLRMYIHCTWIGCPDCDLRLDSTDSTLRSPISRPSTEGRLVLV